MTPPVQAFPASELPQRIQGTVQGKQRKGGETDLRRCDLMELVQYDCRLGPREGGRSGQRVIRCEPIVRLFRR